MPEKPIDPQVPPSRRQIREAELEANPPPRKITDAEIAELVALVALVAFTAITWPPATLLVIAAAAILYARAEQAGKP